METIGVVVNSKAKNAASLEGFLKVFEEQDIPLQVYRIQPDALEESIKRLNRIIPSYLLLAEMELYAVQPNILSTLQTS